MSFDRFGLESRCRAKTFINRKLIEAFERIDQLCYNFFESYSKLTIFEIKETHIYLQIRSSVQCFPILISYIRTGTR